MPNPIDKVRLDIYKGSRYTRDFPVVDCDGNAEDLSGYTAKAQLLDPDGAVVYTATTAAGSLEIDGPAGVVSMDFPGADSRAWDEDQLGGEYDLFVIDPLGEPTAIARGPWYLWPSKTQIP